MESGAILLVNLGASGFLDREAARVFASLFLNEFFDAAMLRANRAEATGDPPTQYVLYLDEFQEYITDDIAGMLDQVRKGGLHIVLAHQHLGHFADNPRLKKSVFTNARMRAVFGGLDYEDACVFGNEMFLPDLNARQIKKAFYHTIHLYEEQTRTIESHTVTHGSSVSHGASVGTGSGVVVGSSLGLVENSGASIGLPNTAAMPATEGWYTESAGLSRVRSNSSSKSESDFESINTAETTSEAESVGKVVTPVWAPIPTQELTTEAEWGREEKLSKIAQLLKEQMQQHCFVKLETTITEPLLVPFVKEYGLSEESLLEYQHQVYKLQGAQPAAHVDHLLDESYRKFLAAAAVAPVVDTRAEHESAIVELPPASQSRDIKTKDSIWDRAQPSRKTDDTQAADPINTRRRPGRGPKRDTENHLKLARIVDTFGDRWNESENLAEICDRLDKDRVPTPKTWQSRTPPSRSWARGFTNDPEMVRKVIAYRRKAFESSTT
jgi:hypothetical protein